MILRPLCCTIGKRRKVLHILFALKKREKYGEHEPFGSWAEERHFRLGVNSICTKLPGLAMYRNCSWGHHNYKSNLQRHFGKLSVSLNMLEPWLFFILRISNFILRANKLWEFQSSQYQNTEVESAVAFQDFSKQSQLQRLKLLRNHLSTSAVYLKTMDKSKSLSEEACRVACNKGKTCKTMVSMKSWWKQYIENPWDAGVLCTILGKLKLTCICCQ